MNIDLATDVLTQIELEPERWDQSDWVSYKQCGTAYCFAGWAVALTTGPDYVAGNPTTIRDTATAALDISDDEADDLFHGGNDLRYLYVLVADLAGMTIAGVEGMVEFKTQKKREEKR